MGKETCNEMVDDDVNRDLYLGIAMDYGSEVSYGNFGKKRCGKPVVWGGKCEQHKVERRSGKDRRRKK